MTLPRLVLGLGLLLGAATGAMAATDPIPAVTSVPPRAAPMTPPIPAASRAEGGILSPADEAAGRAIFSAIRAGRWSDAQAGIDAAPDSILAPVARAEMFLAKNSPRVERDALVALITAAPELPQAPQLVSLAQKRGATGLPTLPTARSLDWVDGQPRRLAARATANDLAAANLTAQARPLLKADKPADAEALLNTVQSQLSPEAVTEWQQRIAWSYYLNADDRAATRLATQASHGAGDWSVQASWVQGLSAWRTHDCKAASEAFTRVASNASDEEMRAAGLFWTARADMSCGRFSTVQVRLRNAARYPETFYGLIASRLLGIVLPASTLAPALTADEWTKLSTRPDVRRAAALAQIGEVALADEMLRWEAKIADDGEHKGLLHLAARLSLPSTQIWLAHNTPGGEKVEISARYPQPAWVPQGGWQIDKALVFAHTLQESRFRTDATSPVGAHGLMGVMSGTADLVERKLGAPIADRGSINTPAVNMAYGQAYLQQLRDASGTDGLLPKVIAAYNAGPGAVARWNLASGVANDPLLYIESIPYAETRGYVTTVLRNYWIYQRQSGEKTVSLKALAQGAWPRFPAPDRIARPGLVGTGGAVTPRPATSPGGTN